MTVKMNTCTKPYIDTTVVDSQRSFLLSSWLNRLNSQCSRHIAYAKQQNRTKSSVRNSTEARNDPVNITKEYQVIRRDRMRRQENRTGAQAQPCAKRVRYATPSPPLSTVRKSYQPTPTDYLLRMRFRIIT
ncbi:hypothetical protein V9T40_010582 [Parthenolecanium corni]|uniref:Uncharacterized protein n=1 Tax=Parthenolecanium corni TaxID=536013 RepID=A0AAN9TIA0_9HEMI